MVSDNHGLSQCLSLGVFFLRLFHCEDPGLGEQWAGCLGQGSNFPIPCFLLGCWVLPSPHRARLGAACSLPSTWAEAAGSMGVSWGRAQSVLWYQDKSQALLGCPWV